MCGEKFIEHSRTTGTGAFSEIEIDTTRGSPPKFVSCPLSHSSPSPIAVLTSAATPSIYLFARGSYAARCLVSRRRDERERNGTEGRKNEREGLPKVEECGARARGEIPASRAGAIKSTSETQNP